jgi:hypothetical protein
MPKWLKIFFLKIYQVCLVSEFYSRISSWLGRTRCGVLTRQPKEYPVAEIAIVVLFLWLLMGVRGLKCDVIG